VDFKNKKNGKPNIAPLQPPTLAAFRPWGSSAGAGRVRPAAANVGFCGRLRKKMPPVVKKDFDFQLISGVMAGAEAVVFGRKSSPESAPERRIYRPGRICGDTACGERLKTARTALWKSFSQQQRRRTIFQKCD
jgi:hypothetical protein